MVDPEQIFYGKEKFKMEKEIISPTEQYIHNRDQQMQLNLEDRDLRVNTERYFAELVRVNTVKNYTWMGVPILQSPFDLVVLQEMIWSIKPDVIIETGIAFGGMLVFYASVLEVIGKGMVLGVDIDPRDCNMRILEHHKLGNRISVVKGSSVSREVIEIVKDHIGFSNKVMVSLDSNHTESHVLEELRLYSPLVSVGSYIIVMDTAIEEYGDDREGVPWGKGNNPMTAVKKWLAGNENFVVDKEVGQRALLTCAPGGFLRRVK
jgi:cephalosporin hydroxylase